MTSKIKKTTEEITNTRYLVQVFTGIPDENYDEFVFATAIEWAEKHCANPSDTNDLTTRPEFWIWWTSCWTHFGMKFVECIHLDSDNEWFLQLKMRDNYGKVSVASQQAMLKQYVQFMEHNMTSVDAVKMLSEHFWQFVKDFINNN